MSSKSPIRVLIVDDQALFRQGVHTLLDLQTEVQVIGEAQDGIEALRLVEEQRPEVVLMDLQMPRMDGVTATRQIQERFPQSKVIALTTFDDDQVVFDALRAGAVGYVLKDTSIPKLIEAIRTVAQGEGFLQSSVTMKVVGAIARQQLPASTQQPLTESLTLRELDILRLVAEGMNNKEIADVLVISEGTVKNHVSNIISKLEVRDRTQAALKAKQLWLI